MEKISQGEKLMLLVKRDYRDAENIAKALGYDKSYLPKLFKMDILPRKPLARAMEVFKVPESYFNESIIPSVNEPDAAYASANKATFERLRQEIKKLKEENDALRSSLEQERLVSANLAEALKNLTKNQ
jgi:hypothetical protein